MTTVLGIEDEKNHQEQRVIGLLPAIQKQDNEALREFFEIYSDDIYNFPLRHNNFSEDEAGDFFLYAFEKLKNGRRLSHFAGRSKFRTWFYAVLRNLVIDFLRSKKQQIRTSSLIWVDSSGELIDFSDKRSTSSLDDSGDDNENFEKLLQALESLKPDQKILFKMAYIHYFELSSEDRQWLLDNTHRSGQELTKTIAQLKNQTLEQNDDVKEVENKLAANFHSILQLEAKIDVFFRENPQFVKKTALWNEDFFDANLPQNVIELIQTYSKKKKRQLNLIQQQRKGLASLKVPYKALSSLFDISPAVISVKIMRIIEKLTKLLS